MTGKSITLPIQGLRCDHCVQVVSAAICAVSGVIACEIDLGSGQAIVETGATPVPRLALEAAVEQAGYTVASAPPKELVGLTIPAHPRGDLAAAAGPTADARPQAPALGHSPDKARTASCERRMFDVEGMHCASCIARVEQALLAVDGVSEAHANLATNQVSVVVDPQRVTARDVEQAVQQAGYRARPAASPEDAAERMAERERAEAGRWRRRFVVSLALLVAIWLVHRFWPAVLGRSRGMGTTLSWPRRCNSMWVGRISAAPGNGCDTRPATWIRSLRWVRVPPIWPESWAFSGALRC